MPCPRFAVWAARDPGSLREAGTKLQRIQIIKGWVEDGEAREAVYDVVGHPPGAAGVDAATCEQSGAGADQPLRRVGRPGLRPGEHAFYYARVLENPSCRWSAYACNALGVACADEDSADEELFELCCESDRPRAIQERAWSSPIWYTPAESAAGLNAMRWSREPVVHFVAIGALLFGLKTFALESPSRAFVGEGSPPAVISAARVAELRRDWLARTGTFPSARALEALIQAEIDDEVLMLEARRLGVHRSDPIVQRRLLRNMSFLDGEGRSGPPRICSTRPTRSAWTRPTSSCGGA